MALDRRHSRSQRTLTDWFLATRPSVLVVEDDRAFQHALTSYLWEVGAIVSVAQDGTEALDVILDPRITFDAIVLDLLLPARDGREVLRLARSVGVTTPILVLTALGAVEDRIEGLRVGADDYLVKPVHFDELHLRLANLIYRSATSHQLPTQLRCGFIVMSEETHQLWIREEEVFLSPTEFKILKYLLMRSGLVLTKETIHAVIWPDTDAVSHKRIDSHIAHLRGKLDGYDAGASIQTIHGLGYRLKANVDVDVN